MGRTIVTQRRAMMGGTQADNYIDKLFKYIPAEVVAIYVGVAPMLKTSPSNMQIGVPALLTVVTYFYLWLIQKVATHGQIILSTFCFIVWVFALGGPFTSYAWYNNAPYLPLLALGVVTMFLPAIPEGK